MEGCWFVHLPFLTALLILNFIQIDTLPSLCSKSYCHKLPEIKGQCFVHMFTFSCLIILINLCPCLRLQSVDKQRFCFSLLSSNILYKIHPLRSTRGLDLVQEVKNEEKFKLMFSKRHLCWQLSIMGVGKFWKNVENSWCALILVHSNNSFLDVKTSKYQQIHYILVLSSLLALPIGKKRLCICAGLGFGLGDKILAHLLTNMGTTNVHRMKIFRWM
jgi:hypothetical protein